MTQTRKWIIFVLGGMLLTLTQPLSAQTFRLGLRDGMSLSWLVGIENTLPQAGFYAGITGDLYLNEHWGVGMDVTFSEQGAICKENDNGVAIDYSFGYLNIPLVAHYRLPLGEQHLKFSAGVQAGIFLFGRYDYVAPSVTGDGRVSGGGAFNRDSFHPADFGATVGVEWGVGATSLEVRYTMGITQTHNGISNTLNGYYYISVPDNRNSVLQIGTIVRF